MTPQASISSRIRAFDKLERRGDGSAKVWRVVFQIDKCNAINLRDLTLPPQPLFTLLGELLDWCWHRVRSNDDNVIPECVRSKAAMAVHQSTPEHPARKGFRSRSCISGFDFIGMKWALASE